MCINISELRTELNKIFDEKYEEFFNRVYGIKSGEENLETDLVSMKEATEFFDVTRTTLNNWIKGNKIISIKKGNQRFFSREYIERYKKANFNYNLRIPSVPDKYV